MRKMLFPEIIDLSSDEETEEVGLDNSKHQVPSRLPNKLATHINITVKEEPVEISEEAARRREKRNAMEVLVNQPLTFAPSINLSSDEETEEVRMENGKHEVPSSSRLLNNLTANINTNVKEPVEILEEAAIIRDNEDASSVPSSTPTSLPCREFWKAGDYENGESLHLQSYPREGRNHLRVHPKFLHSNATSHTWAFGAIAELLDNAIDEIRNGATYSIINMISVQRNGPALLIQDDGGGMDPESMRNCMSFGFSNKNSGSSIGQYGNGFKTSTMRLAADVIVFSRCFTKRTQSIGLLSYTFLKRTNSDDVVVPLVDYKFDPLTGVCQKLFRDFHHAELHFSSNLSAILKWSPFATEADLLKQFDEIGHHGTRIILYNLWFNSDGVLELDFDSDEFDIMNHIPPKITGKSTSSRVLTQTHIRYRHLHSLRAYISILYLHLPRYFKILLRGKVVEPHSLVEDLKFIECIKYNPTFDGIKEEVITTVGFLNDAPDINISGFNVYHKNRLILPFWEVINNTGARGRGVSGVLEANFIKPTHNKQDFEKSTLYFKLETRLKEMSIEYWKYHCHLVGYTNKQQSNSLNEGTNCAGSLQNPATMAEILHDQVVANFGKKFRSKNNSTQSVMLEKRKREDHIETVVPQQKAFDSRLAVVPESFSRVQEGNVLVLSQEIKIMLETNRSLHSECFEFEQQIENDLVPEVDRLKKELEEARQLRKLLIDSTLLKLTKTEMV